MNTKIALFVLTTSLAFATQAQALSLLNDDNDTYTVEISSGQGDASKESYNLPFDHIIEDVCIGGCIIRLSNGSQMEFMGDELVTIKDGAFVIDE